MPIPTSTALPKPLVLGRETQKSPTAPRSTSLVEVDCDIHTVAGAQQRFHPAVTRDTDLPPISLPRFSQALRLQKCAVALSKHPAPDPISTHLVDSICAGIVLLTRTQFSPFAPNNSVALLTVTASTDQSGSPLSAIHNLTIPGDADVQFNQSPHDAEVDVSMWIRELDCTDYNVIICSARKMAKWQGWLSGPRGAVPSASPF